MPEIIKCSRESIANVWPHVSEWLDRCLKRAPPWWQVEDLKNKCLSGDYILWLIASEGQACGVALSELNQYPAALICNVPWIGGTTMKLWRPLLQATLEHWARDAGAAYLTGGGRRGWARESSMKEYGVILVKEL